METADCTRDQIVSLLQQFAPAFVRRQEWIDPVANAARWISIPGGCFLFEKNQPSDCIYIVTSGLLGVMIEKSGTEHMVRRLGPGEIIGEMGCITSTRNAAVTGRNRVLAIFGCLGVAVTLGACREDATSATAPPRPVRTQLVEIIEWKQASTASGEIKPRHEADIGFRIAGKIAARPVDVGTVLTSGAVVARLDNTNEQTAIRIAETDISKAQAELDDAVGQDARQRELLRRGFTTQANYDAADRRLKTARAKLESAELGKRDAAERLGYTELRSDEAGVVTAVGAQVGQVVAAAQMVVRVARTDAKEAEFRVAERTLRSVPRDSVVEVSLLSNPNIKALGHVREIATTADPTTRTFAVRINLESPPEPMRFGTTVQGRVVLEERRVVQLPSAALFQLENSPAVWIFDPSTSTVNPRHLTVLRYEADQVLVSDGLAHGERVVVAGVHKLWAGMKVRLM